MCLSAKEFFLVFLQQLLLHTCTFLDFVEKPVIVCQMMMMVILLETDPRT